MIKQAIILSAGLGTRLRPHTDTRPKPMLPVLGHPMMLWNIVQFKKHGVYEFFINLHYLPDVIKDYFGDGSQFGCKITYSFSPVALGTAGGMKPFERLLDETFFVVYGDVLSLMNYTNMEVAWREKPEDALGMQRVQRLEDYSDADIAEQDTSGKMIAVHPKPHNDKKYQNAYRMRGTFIMKRKIFSFIPTGKPYEIGHDLLPDIVARGKSFYGYECNDYSKGVDTVEKWRDVEEYLKKNNITIDNL